MMKNLPGLAWLLSKLSSPKNEWTIPCWMQQLLLPILLNSVIAGLVGRATALKALCCGFVSCQCQPQREAVDLCPKCSVSLLLRVLVNRQFRPRLGTPNLINLN